MRTIRKQSSLLSFKMPAAGRGVLCLLRDRRANVAIITAVAFPLLLGFVGLASEAGLWMLQRRIMQGVADAAAYSGAVAIANGNSAGYAAEAQGVAAANGYSSGVTVNSPPSVGPYTAAQYGPTGYEPVVEVIISKAAPTLIAAFFGATNVNIGARAVAAVNATTTSRVPQHSDCVLALDPTASGAVDAHGNPVSALNNCGLAVNSTSSTSVTTEGGGTIDVTDASVTLTCNPCTPGSGLSTTSGTIFTNQKPVADPFASLTVPSTAGCSPGGSISSAGTYSPGCYSDITMHPNGDVVRLLKGTYVINGTVDLTHDTLEDCSYKPTTPPACPGGDSGGVTIIVTGGGSFTENGGFTLAIAAPMTGAYAGVAIFQDPADTNAATINGGSSTGVVDGAIYFPKAAVSYIGNEGSNNTGCTVLVADTISFGGTAGSTFGGSTCSNGNGGFGQGIKAFGVPALVE